MPAVGRRRPRTRLIERRLAGAVRAEQRDELAAADVEVDGLECEHGAEALLDAAGTRSPRLPERAAAEHREHVVDRVRERAGDEAARRDEERPEDRAGHELHGGAARAQRRKVRRGERRRRDGDRGRRARQRRDPSERERAPDRLLAHAGERDDERGREREPA